MGLGRDRAAGSNRRTGHRGAGVHPKIQERYRRDVEFRIALDFCCNNGIPYSEFVSWDEEDQAHVIAQGMETRLTCPDCHTRLDEWRNEEGKLIEAYRATDHHCPGCEAIEAHHKHISFQARETGFDMHGIRTKLVEGSREPMRPT